MRSCLREQAIKWSYWIKYLYLHAQSRCTCTQCCAFLNTFFCAVSRTNEAVQSHCLFSRVWRGWINNFSSPPLNSYTKHNGRFRDHQNCHLATIFVKLWLICVLRLNKWRRATLLGSTTLTYEDCTKTLGRMPLLAIFTLLFSLHVMGCDKMSHHPKKFSPL